MKSKVVTIGGASLLASFAASAGVESVLDGGWRLSAGAVYDSGVKTDVKFSPRQTYRSPYALTVGSLSRQQAAQRANGEKKGETTTYVNMRRGGASSSWTRDTGTFGGDNWGSTTLYSFPEAVWDGNAAFELGYAEYEEMQSHQASFASMESHECDESAMPGVNIQLSRNLYHNEEWGWGLEAAFGVQYSRRNKAFRSSSDWFIGRSSKTTGGMRSTYTDTSEYAEALPGSLDGDPVIKDIIWGPDNIFGSGGGNWAIYHEQIKSEEWSSTSTHSSYGSLDAQGDYDNLELMMLLQPYYDVFDWMSVNATVGAVVSRQSMEMSFSMFRDDAVDYRSNNDYSQWDFYGVAGLGLMFYYKGFTLSGDFLARFLDRDMDINDEHFHGTVSRGHWMFRLAIGYEF